MMAGLLRFSQDQQIFFLYLMALVLKPSGHCNKSMLSFHFVQLIQIKSLRCFYRFSHDQLKWHSEWGVNAILLSVSVKPLCYAGTNGSRLNSCIDHTVKGCLT